MNKYSCATTVAGVLAPQSAINSRYLMRVNSQSCRFLPVILAVLVLVAGCANHVEGGYQGGDRAVEMR